MNIASKRHQPTVVWIAPLRWICSVLLSVNCWKKKMVYKHQLKIKVRGKGFEVSLEDLLCIWTTFKGLISVYTTLLRHSSVTNLKKRIIQRISCSLQYHFLSLIFTGKFVGNLSTSVRHRDLSDYRWYRRYRREDTHAHAHTQTHTVVSFSSTNLADPRSIPASSMDGNSRPFLEHRG